MPSGLKRKGRQQTSTTGVCEDAKAFPDQCVIIGIRQHIDHQISEGRASTLVVDSTGYRQRWLPKATDSITHSDAISDKCRGVAARAERRY